MTIDITGNKTIVDAELTKYAVRQLRGIEKLMGPASRELAEIVVAFKRSKDEQTIKLVLTLPKDSFVIEETTVNAYAAVDIVVPEVRKFVINYRARHGGGRLYHRLRMRLARI